MTSFTLFYTCVTKSGISFAVASFLSVFSTDAVAESFSDAGVPVFLCDVKGDVSGLCEPGDDSPGMQKRIDKFDLWETFTYHSYPVTFWDIYGKGGIPIRTTVSDMGPEILARILGLTDVQEGVLNIIFRIADEHDLMLTDLKDLIRIKSYRRLVKYKDIRIAYESPSNTDSLLITLRQVADKSVRHIDELYHG